MLLKQRYQILLTCCTELAKLELSDTQIKEMTKDRFGGYAEAKKIRDALKKIGELPE